MSSLTLHEGATLRSNAPEIPGKYLSIASFRRNGTGVTTPVWFVQTGGRLLVETDADSHKVQRIRRNPHVVIGRCGPTGRPRGERIAARVEILPDADTPRVERLMARKYRTDLVFIKPIRALQAALHPNQPHKEVI